LTPKEICEISEEYSHIKAQAEEAEARGLDHIAGPGYRKALESLIKDYCCHHNQDNQETITRTPLGNVIKNYVDNDRIKKSSELASMVGGDETHYFKKWGDKDIKDLKILLSIAENWIQDEISLERQKQDMESD